MTNIENLPSTFRWKRASPRMKELLNNCDEISNAQPGDTHGIASVLQKMIIFYYEDVREQAMLSFWSALAAGAVGMLILLYAIKYTMSGNMTDKTIISLVASITAQFVSGVSFYLYFKAARQFASFHICLERTNRYLLANTIVDGLTDPARGDAKRALAELIASAPMLTIEAVTGKA